MQQKFSGKNSQFEVQSKFFLWTKSCTDRLILKRIETFIKMVKFNFTERTGWHPKLFFCGISKLERDFRITHHVFIPKRTCFSCKTEVFRNFSPSVRLCKTVLSHNRAKKATEHQQNSACDRCIILIWRRLLHQRLHTWHAPRSILMIASCCSHYCQMNADVY